MKQWRNFKIDQLAPEEGSPSLLSAALWVGGIFLFPARPGCVKGPAIGSEKVAGNVGKPRGILLGIGRFCESVSWCVLDVENDNSNVVEEGEGGRTDGIWFGRREEVFQFNSEKKWFVTKSPQQQNAHEMPSHFFYSYC